MKRYLNKVIAGILGLVFLLPNSGCKKFLKEEIYTQYDPDAFLQTQSGIDALLTGAYSAMQISVYARDYTSILNEFPTDIAFESDGGLERSVLPIQRFTMDASMAFVNNHYNRYYDAISRANNVLAIASTITSISPDAVARLEAEARFIRGFSYYVLHNVFGPTPIIEIPDGASLTEIETIGKETPRATEAEYRAYVEADFLFAAQTLDYSALSSRANKGNSWAMLTKFYLNNKEWQKCINAADSVLAGGYELYSDYPKMFSVEGEDNKEYILRAECKVGSPQFNQYMPHAFPPNYRVLPNWVNFGAQFRTYTAFYETFDSNDIRRTLFLTEYIPRNSSTVVELVRNNGVALDNVRSFKYKPDPLASGIQHGNDVPYVRLADIILAKAEALNELNGPDAASIGLINQIRNRAEVQTILLADYNTKESLRDFILEERGRELFTEGVRREDLIRHGKFIERAVQRGWPAQDFHVLYPLPQAQLDNNANLVQNPGY